MKLLFIFFQVTNNIRAGNYWLALSDAFFYSGLLFGGPLGLIFEGTLGALGFKKSPPKNMDEIEEKKLQKNAIFQIDSTPKREVE